MTLQPIKAVTYQFDQKQAERLLKDWIRERIAHNDQWYSYRVASDWNYFDYLPNRPFWTVWISTFDGTLGIHVYENEVVCVTKDVSEVMS